MRAYAKALADAKKRLATAQGARDSADAAMDLNRDEASEAWRKASAKYTAARAAVAEIEDEIRYLEVSQQVI